MKNEEKLDIRTKVFLLLFTNYLLLKRVMGLYEWGIVVFLCGLLIVEKRKKGAIIYFLLFLLLYAGEHFFLESAQGEWASFLSMLSIGGRLMLPCFMVGHLILSSSVNDFLHAFRKWHVPEPVLLTTAVMLRFLPTIKESYQMIHESLILKGIYPSMWQWWLHPVQYTEYMIVPLLIHATNTAHDLTVATLTKSLHSSHHKTAYHAPRFRTVDYIVMGCVCFCIIQLEWM